VKARAGHRAPTDRASHTHGRQGSGAHPGAGLLVLAIAALAGATVATAAGADEPVLEHRVLGAYPHDPEAYTQGLLYRDGRLYEGTGLYGGSSLREVALATGRVLRERRLPRRYFGEGIALAGGRIVQLTWRAGLGFVYDVDTFTLIERFAYPGEGWGLTSDGARLIMSDGSAMLRFLDPATYRPLGRVTVRDAAGPVAGLNELELIETRDRASRVLANVYGEEHVLVIDPGSGRVEARIELGGLRADLGRRGEVLNGIAHDAGSGRLFVTGKRWPRLFALEVPGIMPARGARPAP